MNTWRKLSALLALCLLAVPVVRAEDKPLSTADFLKAMAELKSEITNSNAATLKELMALRSRLEILEQQMNTVQKDQHRISLYPPQGTDFLKAMAELRSEITTSNVATLKELIALRSRLEILEQRMDTLQKDQRRISLYPPQDTGTIRLENRLWLPATIIVNDVPYRLQPFQTRELPAQPAGTFTFEALVDGFGALQGRSARTLAPNQVYNIFTFMP